MELAPCVCQAELELQITADREEDALKQTLLEQERRDRELAMRIARSESDLIADEAPMDTGIKRWVLSTFHTLSTSLPLPLIPSVFLSED